MGEYHSKSGAGGPVTGCLPVLNHSAVLTIGNELPDGFDLSGGARKDELIPVEESPVIGP